MQKQKGVGGEQREIVERREDGVKNPSASSYTLLHLLCPPSLSFSHSFIHPNHPPFTENTPLLLQFLYQLKMFQLIQVKTNNAVVSLCV